MTVAELISFVRLQLDEQVESYWEDPDLTRYLRIGMDQFLAASKAGLYRQEIIPDTTRVAEKEAAEVIDLTCVGDDTTGLDSINDEYFNLYDTNDVQWQFVYKTAAAVSDDPNIIFITIAPDDTNITVAAITASAINNIPSSPFSAVAAAEVITITWKKKGYVNPPVNVNVDDGTGLFNIAVTTQGYDDGYFLTYPFQRAKSIIYTGSSNQVINGNALVTRIATEDYLRFRTDERLHRLVCYIDPRLSKLVIPFTDASVVIEYFILATEAKMDDILSEIIPEDFHVSIAYYALYLAMMKDNDLNRVNLYLQHYLAMARDAKMRFQERHVTAASDNFDFTNHSVHREHHQPDQSDFLGIGRIGPGR